MSQTCTRWRQRPLRRPRATNTNAWETGAWGAATICSMAAAARATMAKTLVQLCTVRCGGARASHGLCTSAG
eukprot:11047566-Lingulodinium_polyedra.AAC.1